MPRPKVWGDFTEDASFEGEDDAGDDLVEFTCPYNCGKPIRMKARNVIKNKCTECRLHLIKCNGVRADGQKAEDDPRIKALRVATVECADHMRAVKRGRSSSGLPSTNAVAAQDAHTLARHDLETRLDTARAEKASSDAKVYDLERRMRTMEDDMCAMKQFQSTIAHKLGFTTPPLPTVDQCLAVLEGMEKSRAVANMCNSSLPEAQARELRKAKKNHEAAMTANAALRKQVDELRKLAGSQPKLSTHRDRKLMKLFHPDNYPNEPPVVRAAMVKAFKLVSESRQDA